MFSVALFKISKKYSIFIGEWINSKTIRQPEFLGEISDPRPGTGNLSD